MVSKFSQSRPHELASLFCPIFSGISDFAAGSSSVLPLVWQRFFLGALDRPKVLPDSRGFPKFSEGLLCDCERRSGKFDFCLLWFLSQDKEGFSRLLPFSQTGVLV